MVTVKEFKELGKKYGFEIYESIFGGYLSYVKNGIAVSVYDLSNKIVTVCTKIFMGKPYETKIVNDIEELENELKKALKNLKVYKIRQKINMIEGDF